jgi:hypothetical protein
MAPEPIDLKSAKRTRQRTTRPRPPAGESAPRNVRDVAEEAAPEPKVRSKRDRDLIAALAQFYGMVGIGLTAAGQGINNPGLAVAGVNVASRGEVTAEAWVDLAENNPAIRKALEGFLAGSAWATVIGGHVMMAAPVALSLRTDTPPAVATLAWNACLTDEAKAAAALFGFGQAEEAPAA